MPASPLVILQQHAIHHLPKTSFTDSHGSASASPGDSADSRAMAQQDASNGAPNGIAGGSANGNTNPTAQPVDPPSYVFPSEKLTRTMDDSSRTPLLLVACGSFSPITYLHLRMFEMAADYAKFHTDFEVVGGYLSPVADAYKKKGLASADHRIHMCRLASEQAPSLMVDPWEASFEEYTRTALVLDHFDREINVVRQGVATKEGERKKVQIALLAGADLIGTMSTPGVWSDVDLNHILGRYGAFIIERSGTNIDEALANLKPWKKNITVIKQLIQNDVSSTKIRSHLMEKMSVQYLIPPQVIKYIKDNSLYQDDSSLHSRQKSQDHTPSTPLPQDETTKA